MRKRPKPRTRGRPHREQPRRPLPENSYFAGVSPDGFARPWRNLTSAIWNYDDRSHPIAVRLARKHFGAWFSTASMWSMQLDHLVGPHRCQRSRRVRTSTAKWCSGPCRTAPLARTIRLRGLGHRSRRGAIQLMCT